MENTHHRLSGRSHNPYNHSMFDFNSGYPHDMGMELSMERFTSLRAEFESQLKEEAELNARILSNLDKIRIDE